MILGLPCDRNGKALRPLTRRDEDYLIRRAKDGDIAARNSIIASNEGLIGLVTTRMRYPKSFHDDLMQEGIFGLMRAIEKFEPERGLKFSTYAVLWIRAKLQRCLDKSIKHMVWMPVGTQGSMTDFKDVSELEYLESNEDPEGDLIAADLRQQVLLAAKSLRRETSDPRVEIVVESRLLAGVPISTADLAKRLGLSLEGTRLLERRTIARISELVEGMQDDV